MRNITAQAINEVRSEMGASAGASVGAVAVRPRDVATNLRLPQAEPRGFFPRPAARLRLRDFVEAVRTYFSNQLKV